MTQGTQAHKQKKWVLLTVPEGCVARKSGTLPLAQQTARAPRDTNRASHGGAGGRGGRERARGLTRPGGAARMLNPTPPRAGRETLHSEAGGGALAQPPLTGAGSAAAAALSARALPEPGLACAAAPRRRRQRLLCSSGSSSGRHGQAQRGAHPRAARYDEAAVVSGTPRLGASQIQCVPPRGTPQRLPLPTPCIPAARQPPASQPGASLSPERPLLPSLPHPVRIFLSLSRPSRSSVTGAVPLRSLEQTLGDPGPPLGEASNFP